MAKSALIVDDDPGVRDILGAILRLDGWNVDTAADGLQAIRQLDCTSYSVVVLDLLMPLLGGEGVIEHIRARGIRSPVVVVSAATDHDDLDSQVVSVVLHKPIEIGDLRTVLRAVTSNAPG